MDSKNINNIIAVLAIFVVAVAVINLSITFMKVSDFKEKLTGYATGYVNITIASMIQINLTNSSADFGAGAVNASCTKALLTTRGKTPPTVVCGNWTTGPASGTYAHGIVIENNGNINCTLKAQGTNDAANFLGGTAPVYQWNVTMSEPGSCSGNVLTLNNWNTANTTAEATLCTKFSSLDTGDEMTIDVNLSVPADATTGARYDTITISATTAT